jgi:hypothetical protein
MEGRFTTAIDMEGRTTVVDQEMEGRLTTVVDQEMNNFESHENVVWQARDLAVSDLEVSNLKRQFPLIFPGKCFLISSSIDFS